MASLQPSEARWKRRAPNPAYATQSRSRDHVHRAFVKGSRSDAEDRAQATCEAHDVAGWAELLGTARTAQAVAKAIARDAEPAVRKATYRGCYEELIS